MLRYIGEIVERQVARWNAASIAAKERSVYKEPSLPVVTIARELGSGGADVAKLVAQKLNCSLVGYSIVDSIANDLGLPKKILDFMDERLKSEFMSWYDASFCGEMDMHDYHHYMRATIRSLAELGSIVFLGRGAAFVTTKRRKIDVRVVAPRNERIRRIAERKHLREHDAVHEIEKSDKARMKFIRSAYQRDWSDPSGYNFVINTGQLSIPQAAAMIEDVWYRIYEEEQNEALYQVETMRS